MLVQVDIEQEWRHPNVEHIFCFVFETGIVLFLRQHLII